ncbi:kynurenine/alpha-aminoadipate aminotransferase, mitochondrial-like isoform X2 [Haliotis rubra]|nr:kynurenine/alpha-aminoadipate aminotransferase, mitochondrial-like isoform X2 [Haliotis rubra]XP_046566765.1 kynurenine/alpha-aminoadipate aminotransferase, mitochondrial-like isoform X2 [Haliotis rubra]
MNYVRFLNATSLARKPSPIRVLTGIVLQSPPSLISMASGMPNAELFPIKEASLTLSDGSKLNVDNALLKKGLQYSATPGLPEMLKWLKGIQQKVHNPPSLGISDENKQLDFLVTSGSQDGLCKVFEAFVSPGDNILMEIPAYAGTLSIVRPLRANILGVQADKDGIIPESLRKCLSKWSPSDAQDPSSDIPKVLYCIPNGGNPTGSGLTLDRKREIYSIAQEYDLVIMEDDPYFYLQFAKPYIPSFLSMDVDGRVMRFDSLSKLLSSGVRVGFLSGPKMLVNRIALHMQVSVVHVSGMSQALLVPILETMGFDGFLKHAQNVADFYEKKRDMCLTAAEKHLKGLAEWSVPSGGMFLWLKLPGISDTFKMISEKAREKEVLFVPGNAFMPDDTAPCQYVRASYSLVSAEDMDKAFERLAALIREEQT